MIEYKRVSKAAKEPIAAICDACGMRYLFGKDILEIQEFQHIKFTGGYGSIFGDGKEIKYDVCQHCLKELMSKHWHSGTTKRKRE